jgi:hypothetical protein
LYIIILSLMKSGAIGAIYYCLIISAIIGLCSCSRQAKQEDFSVSYGADRIRSFGEKIKPDDSSHKEAIQAIIQRHGLSSTGSIYFSGKFKVSRNINGFCEENEEIYEYRTSHLFSSLLNVIWYKPKTKQTYLLY